jgi:hypothetical protein
MRKMLAPSTQRLPSGRIVPSVRRSISHPVPIKHRPMYAWNSVTVCIAALADVGKSLILACDSMLSTGEFSGDKIALKLYPLTDRFQWWAMISADDIGHIVSVIDAATLKLLDLSDSNNTVTHVERAVVAAYQGVRAQYAEDLVLVPIGLTTQDLKQQKQPDSALMDELRRVDLGCQFLVAGFDWAGDGHIFTIEHPGIARNYDPVGCAAIGSGANAAISTLFHHSVNHEMDRARVLYHVCEAKFMAESAVGVGKHTVVKVVGGQFGASDPYQLSEEFISGIRTSWEQEGKPRIPSKLTGEIESLLRKHPVSGTKSAPTA